MSTLRFPIMAVVMLFACSFLQHPLAAEVGSLGGVYLHLDNTSYLLGEDLRFSATAIGGPAGEEIDSLLHVELLAPEGYVVESRVYVMDGGRCHGKIHLRPSLLSGLFEVRAYTSAMLDVDSTNYFSTVVPLIDRSISGIMSIYDRRREGVNCGSVNKMSYGNVSGSTHSGIEIECDTLETALSGKLRIRLNGMPGSRLSLSVMDSCSMFGVDRRFTIADFIDSYGSGQAGAAQAIRSVHGAASSENGVQLSGGYIFSPMPRAYTDAEKSLADIMGVKLVKPVLPKENRLVVGITHSVIHTTFSDEVKWAKAHGMEHIDFRHEPPGVAFLYIRKSISKRYGYPSGSPYKVRVVSVKGEYPGDSLVPDYLRIYDGGEFDMDDYGEVIIRTDSAICEAFSYGRHAPYYDMGSRSRSMSIGSRSDYPTGSPSMVICMIPKSGRKSSGHGAYDSSERNVAKISYHVGYDSNAAAQIPDGRVLYWNPDVVLDGNGEAIVEFEKNSPCKRLAVSAEGITADGQAVVYR